MSQSTRHKLKATVLRKLSVLRLLRGFDRKAHFAAGGTPADWRGSCNVRCNKIKKTNKYLCRKKINLKEWEE